jgi:hypothetical protein
LTIFLNSELLGAAPGRAHGLNKSETWPKENADNGNPFAQAAYPALVVVFLLSTKAK